MIIAGHFDDDAVKADGPDEILPFPTDKGAVEKIRPVMEQFLKCENLNFERQSRSPRVSEHN